MPDDDKDDGIYKVETVPPPEGEDDPYSAPTRIGPMPDAVVQEIMHAAERKAAELTVRAEQKKVASERERDEEAAALVNQATEPNFVPPPRPAPLRPRDLPNAAAPPARSAPQRDEGSEYALGDDDLIDDSETLLGKAAKPPPIAPSAPPAFPPPVPGRGASAAGHGPLAPSAPPPAPASPLSMPPGRTSTFGSSANGRPPIPFELPPFDAPEEPSLATYVPLLIGFAILLAGIVAYVWAR